MLRGRETAKHQESLTKPAPREAPLRALLRDAEEIQAALDRGELGSRADVARARGISRARVTQILNLLKLDPAVLDAVRNGAPRTVGEHQLRELGRLPHAEQLPAFQALISRASVAGVRVTGSTEKITSHAQHLPAALARSRLRAP